MRRATVTLSDDLAGAFDRYVRDQDAPPSFTAVVRSALGEYFSGRGYLRKQKILNIEPAKRGSGRKDISKSHDSYLASQ